jgi:hypothetical protein
MYKLNFDIPININKDGNWIMIRNFIPVEIPIKPLSVFYGTPVPKNRVDEGVLYIEWTYLITTEYGDVILRDHEYSIINEESLKNYIECVQSGDAELKLYADLDNNMFNEKLQNTIFYIRSRGISYTDALLMSMGNINKRNVLRIEFQDKYLETFFDNNELQEFYIRQKNYKIPVEKVKKSKTVKTKNRTIRNYFEKFSDANNTLNNLTKTYFFKENTEKNWSKNEIDEMDLY